MTTPEDLQARAGEAAALMKAMSNPHRMLILCMLSDAHRASAGELARATGLSPSATSQHLARMRDEGLIDSERAAQRIHYIITHPAVQQVINTPKTLYCPRGSYDHRHLNSRRGPGADCPGRQTD